MAIHLRNKGMMKRWGNGIMEIIEIAFSSN
jgi:hypothetical protein